MVANKNNKPELFQNNKVTLVLLSLAGLVLLYGAYGLLIYLGTASDTDELTTMMGGRHPNTFLVGVSVPALIVSVCVTLAIIVGLKTTLFDKTGKNSALKLLSWCFVALVSITGLVIFLAGINMTIKTNNNNKAHKEFIAGQLTADYGGETQDDTGFINVTADTTTSQYTRTYTKYERTTVTPDSVKVTPNKYCNVFKSAFVIENSNYEPGWGRYHSSATSEKLVKELNLYLSDVSNTSLSGYTKLDSKEQNINGKTFHITRYKLQENFQDICGEKIKYVSNYADQNMGIQVTYETPNISTAEQGNNAFLASFKNLK